ncbi:MAG: HNH endonuclease [Burkholderiales bacterium]|nr:HNH endonuclease [Burkholderiales bacterium]
MTPLQRTRLEKAAADCGFDLPPALVDGALVLRSTRFPESVTVHVRGDARFELAAPSALMLPASGPDGTMTVDGFDALYDALLKAAATARTMPNRVAEKFAASTANLPRSTEAERLVVQRVGQDLFRSALLDYWQGRCCVTGLDVPELLRASHIRPWAMCDRDEERLDVFNGLLLSPALDALFDGGWISFAVDRAMLVSPALPASKLGMMGVDPNGRVHGLQTRHLRYLEFHRAQVFRAKLASR